MSSCRYLLWFFNTFVALAVVAAVLNSAVDPYLVFGSPRITGFSQVKTEINDYVGTAKAFEPFRHDTNVLLGGNSRIEMGLDPSHYCFTKAGQTAYNLGVPGAGVGQQLNYLLNVIYAQPVERVYLSVDFVDFVVDEHTAPPLRDFEISTGNLPRRFDGSENPNYTWAATRTRFQALLSLNALIASIQTIVKQGPYQPNRLENGFNPAMDFLKATEIEGAGVLFGQKMASLGERFASPKSLYYEDGSLAYDFEILSRFLDIAATKNVEVVVLTNPFHEQFWELLRERGQLRTYSDWLSEVEVRVDEAPGRVSMWDFSMDSPFIHEPVPATGEIAPPLDWFWEPSHYRKSLGDKMLESMLATECGSKTEFGMRLN